MNASGSCCARNWASTRARRSRTPTPSSSPKALERVRGAQRSDLGSGTLDMLDMTVDCGCCLQFDTGDREAAEANRDTIAFAEAGLELAPNSSAGVPLGAQRRCSRR